MNNFLYNPDWSLYVITDEQLSGRSHVEIARAAIEGGADVIQLRDKTASGRKLYEVAVEIRQLTRAAHVIFIVNDRLDIALASNADGLHVGQSDLPATVTRTLLGKDKILGVSAESVTEAIQAEQAGADYLGVGPIFEARQTKPDAGAPGGLKLLRDIRQQCSVPLVAIGGINATNIHLTLQAGANAVAIISAIVTAPDIQIATQLMQAKIRATKNEIKSI